MSKNIIKKISKKSKKIIAKHEANKRKKLHIQRIYTLKEVCKIMGVKVPEEFKEIEDIPRENITCKLDYVEEGGIFFGGYNYFNDMKRFYELVREKKPSILFLDQECFDLYTPPKDIKYMVLDDYIEKQGKFFNHVKEQFKIPTIAITGSIGKTTTTQFLQKIFERKYNIFKYTGNWNTPFSIANHIMNKLSTENNLYIQECGAGDLHLVERSAAMLRPNDYILTNVLPHHLNAYKTKENVFKDKTSISRYLKRGGVLVTNFDDEFIKEHKFPHKVISIGIETKDKVDYRAENIVQNGEYLELDVKYKNKTTHIKVNIFGKHNAYNVLYAFAMAKKYKISDEDIQKGLLEFHTSGMRQNVRNIGGITFYVDCYNVCNDSIKATIKTLEEMKLKNKDAKKIAILGGENKLGEKCEEISYQLGKELSSTTLDHIICFSLADGSIRQTDYYGESKPIYKALKDNGYNNCTLITNRKDLVKTMREMLKPGDACLVKGNAELNMTMAIDEIYGTSITMDHEYIPERNKIVEENNFKMKVNDEFGKGSIIEYTGKDEKELTIPDKIAGYPVFRIGRKVFRKKVNLETINFGKSLQNIGIAAFAKNNGIKELHIPGNVTWISNNAFSMCKNLEKVTIENGLLNISYHTFYECKNLKEIIIPESVQTIDEEAFENCDNLTIICKKDTVAYQFAKDNNINFKLEN